MSTKKIKGCIFSCLTGTYACIVRDKGDRLNTQLQHSNVWFGRKQNYSDPLAEGAEGRRQS